MSSGRSSHEAAWASVERTKYLMLSKSMPERSEPQSGIGLRPNSLKALRRRSSIHSGSLLRREMSVTTSSSTPRPAGAPAGAAARLRGLGPPLEPPLGLALATRDVGDDVLVDPAAGRGTGGVGVSPAVLVAAELVDLLVLRQRRADHRRLAAGHARVAARWAA